LLPLGNFFINRLICKLPVWAGQLRFLGSSMQYLFRWQIFFFVIFVSLSYPLSAKTIQSSQNSIDSVLQMAKDKKLSERPEWLAMGHYRFANFPLQALFSGYESYIDDPEFFLAVDGKKDPQAELMATLQSFYNPDAKASDGQPVLCRYQVRYQWLNKQLDLNLAFSPEEDCELFVKWFNAINPGQVRLIFPSSYMNSSSSMFGHTLLRIDPPPGKERVDLISYAVNFGAILQVTKFDPFYAYRGLAGGYPGQFAVMPYHKKVKEYSKIENRDIWEYDLNLSKDEVNKMVLHLWEIGDSNFDYYFIDENCSFRLLSLLDVARPGLNSVQEFTVATIPIDTVRVLKDKGLIEGFKFRPSKATIMQSYIAALAKDEQNIVKDLVEQPELLDGELFQSLPENRKPLMVNTAFQYLRYTQTKKERSDKAARDSLIFLSALNKFPDENKLITIEEPARAENGHKVNLASISSGYIGDDSFADFQYRLVYHDLLDSDYGFLRGTEITFADTTFRWHKEEGLEVEKFDLISIAAFTPRTNFISLPSWSIRTGAEQVNAWGEEHLVAFVDGGRGVSYSMSGNDISYALLLGRFEYNPVYNSNFAPGMGFEVGQLWYLPWGVLQLDASALEMLNADDYRLNLSLEHNIVTSTNSAVRLGVERFINRDQHYTVSEIGFRYHF